MSGTSLVIFLLCAPIMSQTTVLLNAPVGGSVLIHCYLADHPLNLRWFYWQEDRSDNILFHWDAIGKTSPVADKYRNRCHLLSTEFTSGNISFRLDNVAVGDDQKTFWAYVSYDKQKQFEQCCKSTLQVSAPYQDLALTVNNTANSATCTARGGYPEPQVSWSGLNKSSGAQLDLQGAETSLHQDPTEKTFSVITSVSVKELQSVTCLIYNPHSNESLKKTTKLDAPGEDPWRNHYGLVALVLVLVLVLVVTIWKCRRKCPTVNSSQNVSEEIVSGNPAEDGAADSVTNEDTTADDDAAEQEITTVHPQQEQC